MFTKLKNLLKNIFLLNELKIRYFIVWLASLIGICFQGIIITSMMFKFERNVSVETGIIGLLFSFFWAFVFQIGLLISPLAEVKMNRIPSVISLILMLPSTWFFYWVVSDFSRTINADVNVKLYAFSFCSYFVLIMYCIQIGVLLMGVISKPTFEKFTKINIKP